jgi:hypothetical protein
VSLAPRPQVDRLPFFGDLFELIGVAVVGAYAYRYFSDPAERWVGSVPVSA